MILHILGWIALGYVALYLALSVAILPFFVPATTVNERTFRVWFSSPIPKWLGHDGFTCMGVIHIADTNAPRDLICHEWRHTRQELWLGYALYPIAYVLCACIAGFQYRKIWMEADAYAYSAAHYHDFPSLPVSK